MTTSTASRSIIVLPDRPAPGSLPAALHTLRDLGLVRHGPNGWEHAERDQVATLRVIEAQLIDETEVEALWGTYLGVPVLQVLRPRMSA